MARGVPSPAPAQLPKVFFTKVEDDTTELSGVHDLQARSYGYNDFSSFNRPEHYIRHIEPLESELAVQVEYDMDEQDQEWLDTINNERKHDQLNKVSYETFEIIMDRLEKEWFDLTKNIPKPDMALPSEDSTCAICDDAEGENSNAIVFCDGCNLAVHQDCYGVPYIPEGQWLCRKCTVSPENPVSCILCPNEGGAFKQTVHGEWAHLLCAIWVPETRVANDVFMEPITGVDRINKQRWKLKCSLCGIREGACIQCSKTSCFLAFHATCARKEKLLMPMKSAHGAEPATLAAYCEKHLPPEQQAVHEAALAELDEPDGDILHTGMETPRSSKRARAYAKSYKLGPPLVPAIIVRRIMDYTSKIIIRKKPEFIHLVCKYWSLKREARRGAPLLKRLHLEPWTASTVLKQQTEEEKVVKLEHLKRLRKDLELVRMLAELCRKRETQKSKQAQIIHDLLSTCLFSHESHFRLAFERIVTMDKNDYFKNPVSRAEVPDYFDIIKQPMCWNIIDAKLDAHQYWDVSAFKDDINLVLNNALTYNKYDSPIYKSAHRIRTAAAPILNDLEQYAIQPEKQAPASDEGDVAGQPPRSDLHVGDLEPHLSVLELLLSEDAIKNDISLILNKDPITSLVNTELAKFKPPPPPKPKPVRDRKAEKERRLAREQAILNSSAYRAADLSGPRTRRARAAAAAFEAEANATPDNSTPEQEPVHEGDATVSIPRKRSRRPPLVLPGQTEVPPVVDDVDNQRSFKMFDEGWILPSSQRRGGRAPIEKHELPPPRKKIRTDPQRSRLSAFSTSASENQTLQELAIAEGETTSKHRSPFPPVSDDPAFLSVAPVPLEHTDNVEVKPEILPSAGEISFENENNEIVNVITDPDGTTVIEELDTPAIRRAKGMARKRKKVEGAPTVDPKVTEEPAIQQQDQPSLPDDVSDLSSLSTLEDSSDEEVEEPNELPKDMSSEKKAPSSNQNQNQKNGTGSGSAEIKLKPGKHLEGGTLVWAKAETYPWWAAVVFEEDDERIPPNVLESKEEHILRGAKEPLHLVQFYDNRKSWQWLEVDFLRLLGEDRDLDASMVSGGKRQRFRNSKVRGECRAAYRKALAEMETDGDNGQGETSSVQADKRSTSS